MSASLQYSNYMGQADFAVPYEVLAAPDSVREMYLESCHRGMDCYGKLCSAGIGHDAAGYATPQGLRNVLLISATPYQWKHIIGQRICRRNTGETRIVLLKIKLIDFGVREDWHPCRTHGNDAEADVCMPYDCTLKPGDVEKVPLLQSELF